MKALDRVKQIIDELAEEHGTMAHASRALGQNSDFLGGIKKCRTCVSGPKIDVMEKCDERFAEIADDLRAETRAMGAFKMKRAMAAVTEADRHAKEEIAVMRAIKEGAHYQTVIRHRLGMAEHQLRRVLMRLLESGVVTVTKEKANVNRYDLVDV